MHYHFHKHLSKKQDTKLVDRLMSIASVFHPLFAVPQIYSIYSTQNAAGVSLWTWFGFLIMGIVFLLYGLAHKIKPFIVMQTLWLAVNLLVVIGIILY